MEDKPVTDLVLLPPLELTSLESLPKPCSAELALQKKERDLALSEAAKTYTMVLISGIFTGLYGWVAILAWLHTSLTLAILTSVFFVGISAMLVAFLRLFVQEVRAYRQIEISPQLQLGADTESRYFDMAKLTNEMSVDLNITMENEMRKDPSERNLQELKRKRALLSENIEEIKAWANGGLKPKID